MRKFLTGVFLYMSILVGFSACQRAQICPAYQSTFIFDDSVRYKMFSRFEPNMRDPKPKPDIERTWYGVVKKQSKRKREKEMAIVEMRNVFPPDSFTVETNATDITPNDEPLDRGGRNQR